ncbi:hypothetical protein RP20_CCG005044 [Aedes albopictus]|nr:hypothetical protein RP20_CCG005044 [Aedes albopictus]
MATVLSGSDSCDLFNCGTFDIAVCRGISGCFGRRTLKTSKIFFAAAQLIQFDADEDTGILAGTTFLQIVLPL